MILASFGGRRRAILGPMLGDVGCKMGPRWVQEGFESEFFAQLGVLMGILAPRWQDKASQDGVQRGRVWKNLKFFKKPSAAGGRGVVQQGGGGSKDPRVGL